MVARPVVKWAGGKARLVPALLARMPARIDTFVEPFAGGAALFFALASEEPRRFERAVLSDMNEDLVACYRALKEDVEALVARVAAYERAYFGRAPDKRAELFYDVRGQRPRSDVERGARLLFLNKTCFNGLWRVNASGKFNVPFGRYDKPRIFDEEGLRAAHAALQHATIERADFEAVTKKLGPRDFAYFDPPYVPVSRTANFTAYAREGFGLPEQERLARLLVTLRGRRVKAILSNTDSPLAREIYGHEGFRHESVPMRRGINSDPTKRGPVDELLVMNFGDAVEGVAEKEKEAS